MSTFIIGMTTFTLAAAAMLSILAYAAKAIDSWRDDKITERRNTIEAIHCLEHARCCKPLAVQERVVADLFRVHKLPLEAYREENHDVHILLRVLRKSLDARGHWLMNNTLATA